MAVDFIPIGSYFANLMPRIVQVALGYDVMVMIYVNIMKERNR